MEATVKIAFDLPVYKSNESSVNEVDYFVDEYTSSFIPINGSKLTYRLNTQTSQGITTRQSAFARGDHFCPLHTVLTHNNIKTEFVLKDGILKTKEKFLYYISPRYFVKLHTTYPKVNYLKDILTQEHIHAINNGQCLFIICDIFESAFYTPIVINSLKEMCHEINLDISKIILFTNNIYNVNKTELSIVYWQYFETATKLAFLHKLFKSYNIEEATPFFRFLLLNCKTRQHRFYICYKLWQRDPSFFKNFSFSLNKTNLEELTSGSGYITRDMQQSNFNYFVQEYKNELHDIEKFIALLPQNTVFDQAFIKDQMHKHFYRNPHREQICPNTQEQGIFCKINHWKHFNTQMATKTGIHIVTETLADFINSEKAQYMFVTEKTFKPILFKKPFIIVGQQGILQHLRQCGYMTFNSLWDESYDNIQTPQDRYDAIIDTIIYLSSLNEDMFNEILLKTKEIVNYNYQVFMKSSAEKEAIETIINFLRE